MPFQAVVIGLMTDGILDPVVVSSCIFLEDESSEVQAAGVVSKVGHLFVCLYPNLHRIFLTNQYCSLVVFILQINSLKHRLGAVEPVQSTLIVPRTQMLFHPPSAVTLRPLTP